MLKFSYKNIDMLAKNHVLSSSPRLVLLKLDVAVHVPQAIFIHVSIAPMYDVHPSF
jgi:hypothetical protein